MPLVVENIRLINVSSQIKLIDKVVLTNIRIQK